MNRFLIISCLSLLLLSCKSYQIQDAVKKESAIKEFKNPYFFNNETDYVYKAHIETYGTNLSGIFIVKKINDSVHRVVLTTDFGNKLLDFELSQNTFKVNYILENLNRKIIINTLRDDIRLLLKSNSIIEAVFENENYIIFKSKERNTYNYFYQNKIDGSFRKLINTSKTKEKVAITFLPKNTTFAESIIIKHNNIKLKIELNQITN